MSVALDFDGKRRSDNPLLTAGPYEADPKFLPGSRPAPAPQLGTISFDLVKPLPKELAVAVGCDGQGIARSVSCPTARWASCSRMYP